MQEGMIYITQFRMTTNLNSCLMFLVATLRQFFTAYIYYLYMHPTLRMRGTTLLK